MLPKKLTPAAIKVVELTFHVSLSPPTLDPTISANNVKDLDPFEDHIST